MVFCIWFPFRLRETVVGWCAGRKSQGVSEEMRYLFGTWGEPASEAKHDAARLHICMSFKFFTAWLVEHENPGYVLDLLDLIEVSGEFPKGEFNALFRQQFARRVSQVGTEEAQQQLMQLHDFDFIGYIARSLRSAGFSDADIDPNAHDIVVKLLVQGQLFPGWDGKSPLIARFKVATKNAILNQVEKRQVRRRRIPSASIHNDDGVALDIPAQAPTSNSLIDQFRDFLRRRHGAAAVEVLDHRLNGGEVKELIGRPGLETSYRLKQTVQAIKQAAEEFAAGDETFLAMVRRAMASEAETVGRRFAGKTA
jgi:DNA-directed RNA polymerase specialized sigma24 family protein